MPREGDESFEELDVSLFLVVAVIKGCKILNGVKIILNDKGM